MFDAKNELAEGPVWYFNRLWWVNISAGEHHQLNLETGLHEQRDVGAMLGAAVPAADGRWVLASKRGLEWLDWGGGGITPICNPESDQPDNRFNDGKCDPAGRFWVGSMSLTGQRGRGALYVLDRDLSLRSALAPVSLSNGLAWSAGGRTMFHIDTPTRQIAEFDFDFDSGAISNRRIAFDFESAGVEGHPDGMTIDREDRLWVAMYGGWAVVCVDMSEGRVVEKVELPVANATSCCFGGDRLETLFITTAAQGLSAEQRRKQPGAGGIFVCRPGARGFPVSTFVT
jgi:sugar lactone lactonase YvrE